MTLDNMTGITEGSYTGFCKSQLITCNFVKACNGVCPFEDALKHADKMQTMNVQLADKSPRTVKLTEDIEITLDEEAYEIGYTHGQMADRPKGEWIQCSEKLPEKEELVLVTVWNDVVIAWRNRYGGWESVEDMYEKGDVIAWMPLPEPYRKESEVGE